MKLQLNQHYVHLRLLLLYLDIVIFCRFRARFSLKSNFYTEQVIYEQDVRLAAQLAERIGEVANTEHPFRTSWSTSVLILPLAMQILTRVMI